MDASLPLLREVVNSSTEAQLQDTLHHICESSPAVLRDTIHRLCEVSSEARKIACEDLILKKLKEIPAVVPNVGREAEAEPKAETTRVTGHKRKREQATIKVEDRWQVCKNCDKSFDLNNNADTVCVRHSGKLTVTWPGVFIWSCCDKLRLRGTDGCEISAHTPKSK